MANLPTQWLAAGSVYQPSGPPADAQKAKESPGEWPGLVQRRKRLEGPESLDASIVFQSTNQARRGSRKRPDPPVDATGLGLSSAPFSRDNIVMHMGIVIDNLGFRRSQHLQRLASQFYDMDISSMNLRHH
jgi:hypothetical protein